MQYALLVYSPAEDTGSPAEDTGRADSHVPDSLAAKLGRPHIAGWARLHAEESATTLRNDGDRMLLTDGPFIDSKEYLGDLLQETRPGSAIEVRPVLGGHFRAT
jgi:hypothetical protein